MVPQQSLRQRSEYLGNLKVATAFLSGLGQVASHLMFLFPIPKDSNKTQDPVSMVQTGPAKHSMEEKALNQ